MYIPRFVRKNYLYKRIRRSKWSRDKLIKSGKLIHKSKLSAFQNKAPALTIDLPFDNDKMPLVGIVYAEEIEQNYVPPLASSGFYERFCITNGIPYTKYNIHCDNWIQDAEKLDIIMWHVSSIPYILYEAESKLYILEKLMRKMCFPSFHEVWHYEDKVRSKYLYDLYSLPSINSFVTHSRKEALEYAKKCDYPVISKLKTGAGSFGVEMIKTSSKLQLIINKVFGSKGRKTFYPFERQKNYLLLQEFIEDATYDLRVMIIGNKAFGWYRYPRKGDFKASGSGIDEKKALPKEAIQLAIITKRKIGSRLLGVDFLYCKKREKFLIIETSVFNQIDTCEELVVNDIPGYYDISDPDNIIFKPGRFWIHELVMQNIVSEWIQRNKDK